MSKDNGIVIGKRISFGAIVGGILAMAVWSYNLANPDNQMPAHVAIQIQAAFIAVAQIIIVNRGGITK